MPTYDPAKNYHWPEDEKFEMSGIEFASFYHLLVREMNNQGGANMAIKVEAYGVMMRIFQRGVEVGKIVVNEEKTPETVKGSEDPMVKNMFS